MNKKIFCIITIILILLGYSGQFVKVEASETDEEITKFYMDKEECDVTAGDDVEIKLNLCAKKINGVLSIFEYDKDLCLKNIEKNNDLNEKSCIYSPQIDENGNINEIVVNGKKRFIFIYVLTGMREEEFGNVEIATITLTTPANVPKDTAWTVGWNIDPQNTYVENKKGTKKLEEFKDCIIRVTKSDYVPSKSILQGANEFLLGAGNELEKTEQDSTGTIQNNNGTVNKQPTDNNNGIQNNQSNNSNDKDDKDSTVFQGSIIKTGSESLFIGIGITITLIVYCIVLVLFIKQLDNKK